MSKFQSICFDFGGVLLNLDMAKTYHGLSLVLDPQKSTDLIALVLEPFERGEISELAFLNRLQRRSIKVLDVEKYIDIWNSMLLDFPKERLDMLADLRSNYKLYLLSNTNIMHIREVDRIIYKQHGIKNFAAEFFDDHFFSFQMGLIKPDPKYFKTVIERTGIPAEHSLFIDDTSENTASAKSLGFNVHTHTTNTDITATISNLLNP